MAAAVCGPWQQQQWQQQALAHGISLRAFDCLLSVAQQVVLSGRGWRSETQRVAVGLKYTAGGGYSGALGVFAVQQCCTENPLNF